MMEKPSHEQDAPLLHLRLRVGLAETPLVHVRLAGGDSFTIHPDDAPKLEAALKPGGARCR